jgi:hypothetical protein
MPRTRWRAPFTWFVREIVGFFRLVTNPRGRSCPVCGTRLEQGVWVCVRGADMTTGPLLLAFRFQILRLARRRPCRPVRRHHLVSPGLLAPATSRPTPPENPVLLTVDQELGEGATLRVARPRQYGGSTPPGATCRNMTSM